MKNETVNKETVEIDRDTLELVLLLLNCESMQIGIARTMKSIECKDLCLDNIKYAVDCIQHWLRCNGVEHKGIEEYIRKSKELKKGE